MTKEGTYNEVDYYKTLLRLMVFAMANATVFVAFCFLWIWQYHIDSSSSNFIDEITVPWLWLAGFFTASFLGLRVLTPKVVRVSLLCAVVFSFFLWLMVIFILIPSYDRLF